MMSLIPNLVGRDTSLGVAWLKPFGNEQQWILVNHNGSFQISSVRDPSLFMSVEDGILVCSDTPADWAIVVGNTSDTSDKYVISYITERQEGRGLDLQVDDSGNVVLRNENVQDISTQYWSIVPAPALTTPPKSFSEKYFPLTIEQARDGGPYDIIVIGTGIGGGVLAGDLFETYRKWGKNKKILIIERGDLIFHSHSLNTSRPNDPGPNRGQDNDAFYRDFKSHYKVQQGADWSGGPLYCLGGRSPVWGLFAPRPHDETLRVFTEKVRTELLSMYFERAETLMKLSTPATQPIHQHVMDRLNMRTDRTQWMWGRITSEFKPEKNFNFTQGAYSPIDKLLEIAMMSKTTDNFKILLNTEVLKIEYQGVKAVAVHVRDPSNPRPILLANDGKVVLCAGSVHSAAILLRSGIDLTGGTRVTDHDIYYVERRFNYSNPLDRDSVGPMKLQTYARFGIPGDPSENDVVLVNASIDAPSFLPRRTVPNKTTPKFIIVFMLGRPLNSANSITRDENGQPVVTIQRQTLPRQEDKERTLGEVLKLDFQDQTVLKKLPLGAVAHELGSIPMPNLQAPNQPAFVDEDLKLSGYQNVFVCDLSVLPYSVEANPSLTLAALALRLSRKLLPIPDADANDVTRVYAVNHTGQNIRVRASKTGGADEGYQDLRVGQSKNWVRVQRDVEAIFVRKNTAREEIYLAPVGSKVFVE